MTMRTAISRRFGLALAIAAAPLFAGVLGPSLGGGFGPAEARAAFLVMEGGDTLLMRSGQIIEGEVIEETDTTVTFKVMVGSISAEQVYKKSDILKIERGEDSAPDEDAAAAPTAEAADPVRGAHPDAKNVYVIELKGKFGEDISQSPVRDAVKDAKKHGADYIIVVMDNDWSVMGGMVDLPDDPEAAEFDELFRAEDIAPVLTSEIRKEWENPPKVVFWVKQAMGGAAFLPFISDTVYMHPESRWGGVGNLSMIFGSMGDEMVRQKQYSLRMGHAEGLANLGGYDYRILRAMARIEYVLSVKYEGGRPVLLENKMPENPDEYLLTDDGEGEREDTDRQRASGEGDDVLTLTAELAKKLLISKGTASTIDDVLYQLGIARQANLIEGRSEQIMESWTRGLDNGRRELRRLWNDYGRIQVGGDYDERQRARGRQIAILNDMLRMYMRYGEGISAQWRGQNGIPSEPFIKALIDQIKLQQLQDRR